MTLIPKLPPGRANRKALQFAGDIRRMRKSGYTFSAIRIALLDAGVEVSLTTIKREAARQGGPDRSERLIGHDQQVPLEPVASLEIPSTLPSHARSTSGREIAEAFFSAHPCNPLFPTKETP
jgi:hypothetical protein